MKSITILLPLVVLSCATPGDFRGRVTDVSGAPAENLNVYTFDYRSPSNSMPWNWFPGRKIRGKAYTDQNGEYLIHSSTDSPDGIRIEGEDVFYIISDPSPDKFQDIRLTGNKSILGKNSNKAVVPTPQS